MDSLICGNQSDLIHDILRYIKHLLFWFLVTFSGFDLNLIHIYIFKVIHI